MVSSSFEHSVNAAVAHRGVTIRGTMFPCVLHRDVFAVSACFYCISQVGSGVRKLLTDAFDSILQAPSNVYTSSFGSASGASLAPTQAIGAREFASNEFEFAAQSIRAAQIRKRLGFLQLFLQVRDAAPVLVACLVIECRTRVTCDISRRAHEVEYVQFLAWL